ncbi:LamG domain-containing protein [Candidatus Woesearchaeota archaeon]|nr:LamG domain-containing protein [Candidatus Woesearchaeota archaeon]MBW2993922.1 LamG domain-containing protein [Candidatus Woesearchaeota archaeon]
MGSKRVLLAVLVLILLSSTAYAVDFKWALGNSATKDARSTSYTNEWNSCFVWGELDAIAQAPSPVIVTYEFLEGATCANRCGTKFLLDLFYDNNLAFRWNPKFNRGGFQDRSRTINVIADRAHAGGSCDWHGGSSPGTCGHKCDFDGNVKVEWVDIDTSNLGSVFPKDGVVSLGRIKDLYPADLLPDNDTIYLGLYTENYGDVMYWFGDLEEDPSTPLKKETDDYYEYVNVCSDRNHNLVCDYIDAEPCYNAGADWYGDPDHEDGICCGPNPVEIKQQTGLDSTDCKFFDDKAYCGKTLAGQWTWAPLNEIGSVYSLLDCPGKSMVSEGNQFKTCEPSENAEAKFFSITHTLGTHGYLCSNGEIFECAGDLPSYSENKDFVAETGISTNDLIGSGGCPPKIVAYWPLEGNAVDVEGSYDGAIVGATSTSGKIDSAMHFESGNKISLPADLPITGDQFTVEAWIRPTQTSGVRNIIEKENSFKIAIDSNLLVGAVNTDTAMIDFGSRQVVSNTWHHVALVYNGEKAFLYLDGIAVTDDDASGPIVWSNKPIILGSSFIGDIDEVAIYDKSLRSSLIKRHAKMPSSYCQTNAGSSTENYYCAADGEWTTDLDIKDESSCNKAGFVWTGNLCCSEDDDVNEYYNDADTPAADLAKIADGGQTVAAHAGAQVESGQVILNNIKQYITVKGPAKLQVEMYSAESVSDIGDCPVLSTDIVNVAPWENKTILISSLGRAGSSCRYRWKIITSKPLLAIGGCWDGEFVPIGHFASSGVLNYHGGFYSCGVSSASNIFQLIDYHTNSLLVSTTSPDCNNIMLNAKGSGIHAVCNPGNTWQFTNNSAATTPAKTKWNVSETNASQWGCCTADQCWTGFDCSNIGKFYKVDSTSYYCDE